MGYFWAIFDAMLMVLIFSGLKAAVADSTMPGIDFPVFLATGFLAFFLFKNIVSRSQSAFSANSALFSYTQVKPFDTIVVRLVLEILVSTLATLIFIGIGLYFEFDLEIQNFNMVMLAVVWMVIFAFGLGLFSAVVGLFYENYKKILNVLMTPLLFISALMYTVHSLPPALRELILYNPVTHFIEMIHGYYFITLDTYYVDYEYMMYWTIIPLFLGLYFYTHGEKKLRSQ